MIQITKVFVSSFDKRGMQKDQLPFVTVDPLCLISVKKLREKLNYQPLWILTTSVAAIHRPVNKIQINCQQGCDENCSALHAPYF